MIHPGKVLGVILLNLAIVAFEIFFGIAASSMSLITDALHNMGDVLSLIIAFTAILFSRKKPSSRMSYGYIRSEMMAGFINSLFLIGTMIFVAVEAVDKLLHPTAVNGVSMMIVAGVAVIANGLSAFLMRENHDIQHACVEEDTEKEHSHDPTHSHQGGQESDINIKAAYLHLISDAGLSLGVILSGALITLFKIPQLDAVFSIAFSAYILVEAAKILRTAFLSLMDATSKNLDKIEASILSHPEVMSLHDIHLSRPSSREVFFSSHLVLKGNMSLEEIETLFEIIRKELSDYGVTHSLLQPESAAYHNADKFCQSHHG